MSTVAAARPGELADGVEMRGVEMRRAGVATQPGGDVAVELDLDLLRPVELTQVSSFATIAALLVVQAVWLIALALVAWAIFS